MQGLTPYVPGEQPKLPNLVKLNTNENPYGPSPRVLEALRAEIGESLRLYPDPLSERLRQAIAMRHEVTAANVFVGNGSDEVLAHTFHALLKHDAPVLFPDVTYSFYPVYCRLYGIEYREVPLTSSFEIAVDDYRAANGGIIFPNPNAPTARLLAQSEIERLLQTNRGSVVVVDEAYVNFGGVSAVPLVSRYPNLLVTHTLSKSRSLAGLRVGYAIGNPGLIEALNRVKDSFNSYPLGRIAQAGATASVRDAAWFRESCAKVIAGRDALTGALTGLGFDVLPSSANFVFARHPARRGAEFAAALRERAVLVRHFDKPRIAPYLRITVGTADDTARLIAASSEVLRACGGCS